jgi:aspartate racemase
MKQHTFGVIGGLGSLAGADLFFKLVRSEPVLAEQDAFHFLFEQHPFRDVRVPLNATCSMTARKLYVFQVCQSLVQRRANSILLPCFASHTFRDELQSELPIPIVDMMVALRRHVDSIATKGATLGVIASDFVRLSGLFEKYFSDRYDIIYPSGLNQAFVMSAIYGEDGIKAGKLEGHAIEHLAHACEDLQRRGAEWILPGATELSLVCQALQRRGYPVLDGNALYAEHAVSFTASRQRRVFKLGIVGGVGPAATVDFMDKVVRSTPASRDQDHIKMVVEQNPQIPDRTAHLLRQEADPTVSLYATCKRLESEGASAIAIPCNTAHAFVQHIQPYLAIPIVNMLTETIAFIRAQYGTVRPVGLLATSGTIASRVYHNAAQAAGITLMTPTDPFQEQVMSAIYGEHGVKAGHVDGACRDSLRAAIEHLALSGAKVIILGCTELPLIYAETQAFGLANGRSVVLVDPTAVLARHCVGLAQSQESKPATDALPECVSP